MAHVFISYARRDRDFVDSLKSRLANAGIAVWSDSDIHAGTDFLMEIGTAIRESYALVVVMTPEAKESQNVTFEWSSALGIGIPVIPILLDSTAFHPRLLNIQYLDFTHRAAQPWDTLIQRLKELEKRYRTDVLFSAWDFEKVRSLIDGLDSADSKTRQAAIEALRKIGDSAAVPALLMALKHPLHDVREQAAHALSQIGYSKIPELLSDLGENYDPSISTEERKFSHHVFLSYSHEDASTMHRVRDDLVAEDFHVWADLNLKPGTHAWKDAIENAIENALCLVVILSPNSKKSKWVEREIDYASAQGIPIFPLLAKGNERTAIPLELISDLFIDIRTSHRDGMRALIGSIRDLF